MEKEQSFVKENQDEALESALDSIMTAEEYGEIEHSKPYIFDLKMGDIELHYFGSPHINDPENPLFNDIEAAFNKANPDIVFVEGLNANIDKNRFSEGVKSATREELISRMGESGLALKLGVDKEIDWESPEPSDKDLYSDLLAKGFSEEQIFAWDIFHMLPQYNRQMNKQGFRQYAQGFIDQFVQATNWKDFDYSYERAIKLGEQICGEAIDVENDKNTADRIDPIPWKEKKDKQTVLNRISEESSAFRDRKIVSDIAKAMETHKRAFIVYGASHAVMQEPALRKIFIQQEKTN